MMTSLIEADSLLVIDVGSITTRAMLFDDVDSRYRFLGAGSGPTTAGAPYHNVGEGVRIALDRLQNVTGRRLVGADEQLIIPSTADGSGVDMFAAMISVGAPLKIVVAGLLEDVSLESARRLVASTYGKVAQVLSLNDRRKPEARIDAILRLSPDLIVVAGGTDNGASQSVMKLLESIGLACYLMPQTQRPEMLYVGNQALREEIQSSLGGVVNLNFAQNVRPAIETEQLDPARLELAKIFTLIRSRQIPGVEDLRTWAKGNVLPTAMAFGRIVRYLSKAHSTKGGVLGVDVGASATSIAAAFSGYLTLGVYPQLGLGEGLAELLDHVSMESLMRWFGMEIADDYVREYLINKSLYPASLPVTQEDVMIEQAIARQAMQSAVRMAASGFPPQAVYTRAGLLPWVEPIIATGSVLTRAPNLAQSALMILDGLQPTGITTLVLDQNHIIHALGAAASVNPILTIQTLDSGSFLYLGTVIAPVGRARWGTPVLRLKMTYESGHEVSLQVKQGSLETLPLPIGQTARLHLQPLHRFDVNMGAPGRGGNLRVMGGALGVIIDARGRPLVLPSDRAKRYDLFKKWQSALGAL